MLRRLKQWLGYDTRALVSPLPRMECAARLRALTQSEWMLFGGSPLIGSVGETTLKVRKRPPLMMRNSFQTYLRGTFESEGMATRLTCRFGLHPFVAVFMVFWFGMLWVFALGILAAWLKHPADTVLPLVAFAGPAMMTLFGVGIVTFCRYLARDEQRFLLDLLRETIEAREPSALESARAEPVVKR